MSLFDYKVSEEIAKYDYPFDSLIMAAFRKADTGNFQLLEAAFPKIADELKTRYNLPGGKLSTE